MGTDTIDFSMTCGLRFCLLILQLKLVRSVCNAMAMISSPDSLMTVKTEQMTHEWMHPSMSRIQPKEPCKSDEGCEIYR